MEVETKYIAPHSAPFVALMQAPEVGGFHLEPMQAVSMRDVYLDTVTGDLLRQGYVFRVREQEGDVLATLKSLGGAEGALHRRLEFEAALGTPLVDGRLPILPDGEFRDVLDRLVGREALQETVRLRQYRTPRAVFDGARLVGLLSLDVVAQETRRGLNVTNEVEVELAETGREEDLYRLDPVLRSRGLEPVGRSKFERALLRLQADAGTALLLLPAERFALERYQAAGTPLHRRRARVILLASRGLRPATIANKAGLSPSRVQHWIEAFRADRLDIFTGVPEEEEPLAERRSVPSYRVSELVTGGTPRPSLFRRDHFEPEFEPEAAPEIERREEVEAERQAAEPVPPHTFGDGSHVQPDALAATYPGAPAVPDAEEDATPRDEGPSDEAGPEAKEEGPGLAEESGEAFEDTRADERGVRSSFGEVESLDDLLDLLDSGPVTTPRLSERDSSPEVDSLPETAETDPVVPEFDTPSQESSVADTPPEVEASTEAEETTGGSVAVLESLPPAEAAVPTSDAEGTPSEAEPRPGVRRSPLRRPVLSADDPVLASCERVLRYHYDSLAEATDRLLDQPAPPAVRRTLIAAHRVRIALELFGDYLPPRTARRLHRGLRGTARALDHLGDQDLVLAHLTDAQATAPGEDRPAFDALLEAIEGERQAAWLSVALRLRGALHQQWARRFERMLDLLAVQVQAGLSVGDHAREEPDDYLDEEPERPMRDRLRHMLGSTLWDRYEALRAYDAVVGQAGDELLHPLGVACSALQFGLGLAAGCAADEVRPVARPLAEVESHLALLHHVRLTLDALAPYADVAPVVALRARLHGLHDETLRDVPQRWERVSGPAYRDLLARVVASI